MLMAMNKLCFAVASAPNNVRILECYLERFINNLPDDIPHAPHLYVLCDTTIDKTFSIKEITGMEAACEKLNNLYNIKIELIRNNNYPNGHGYNIDNFIAHYGGQYEYTIVMDDDAFPNNDKWIPKLLEIILDNPDVSCFGSIIEGEVHQVKDLYKSQHFPRLHPSLLVIKNKDFLEMETTISRKHEGFFTYQFRNSKFFPFCETCSIYFMDLIKNDKIIFDLTKYMEENLYILEQGTLKLYFEEPFLLEKIESNFFERIGASVDKSRKLSKDLIFAEIHHTQADETLNCYTFSCLNTFLCPLKDYQIEFLKRNNSTLLEFDLYDERDLKIAFKDNGWMHVSYGGEEHVYSINQTFSLRIIYTPMYNKNMFVGFKVNIINKTPKNYYEPELIYHFDKPLEIRDVQTIAI